MNEKLNQYLNGVFAPYDGAKSVADLKADLLTDLQERFRELKNEGMDDETAFKKTVDSIGDIEQTLIEVANLSRSLERQVHINISAIDMQKSDFAGITAHSGKYSACALRGSDFSNADLTGSTFETCDVRETNFDGANLTDCSFSITDLTDASFRKSNLVRTNFTMSGQGAKFINDNFIDVKLTKTDLRSTVFEKCNFNGVDFNQCDLRGIHFEGQTFTNVKFDKSAMKEASFRRATLKNITFIAPFSLTNSSYLALKTICFDEAMMDKLTYASLKSLYVFDLSKVIVI